MAPGLYISMTFLITGWKILWKVTSSIPSLSGTFTEQYCSRIVRGKRRGE